MKIVDLFKTIGEISFYKGMHRFYQNDIVVSDQIRDLMNQIDVEGIVCIPNFFDLKTVHRFRQEIDLVLEKYKSQIWRDNENSDHRAMAIDRVSSTIKEQFYNNDIIKDTRQAYYNLRDENILGCTLGAKLIAKDKNKGSGGGWHRDTVNIRQFKAITYLSDVDDPNGPFQYLVGSHRRNTVISGITKHGFGHNHNRFTQSEIQDLIDKEKFELRTYTASAGSLILVDTSGIHRGKPIENGTRYALTNYYWVPKNKGGSGIPNHMRETFILPSSI